MGVTTMIKAAPRLQTQPVVTNNSFLSRFIMFVSRQMTAYLFLLPALLIFALVAWYPIGRAFQMSFQDVQLRGESVWNDYANYEKMEKDPATEAIWENTFEFASLSLLMGYSLPILLAILIREMRFGGAFFRVAYFLPTVVPVSISVIVWRFIYNPDSGVLNDFIAVFGIQAQRWLNDPGLVKPAIILIATWGNFGATTLIYLSSLQEIATELYEAAELDGASPVQRVWHITLPHLRPIMSLLFVLQVLAVAQLFTEPFLLTRGGPGRETLTPVLHMYNRAFMRMDMGNASAWGVTLVIFLMLFSGIYQIINRRFNTAS
jgi:multiple sugar transport system permease protein